MLNQLISKNTEQRRQKSTEEQILKRPSCELWILPLDFRTPRYFSHCFSRPPCSNFRYSLYLKMNDIRCKEFPKMKQFKVNDPWTRKRLIPPLFSLALLSFATSWITIYKLGQGFNILQVFYYTFPTDIYWFESGCWARLIGDHDSPDSTHLEVWKKDSCNVTTAIPKKEAFLVKMASNGKRIGSGSSKFNTYMEPGANAVFGDGNTFHFGASESSKRGKFMPVRPNKELGFMAAFLGL